MTPEEKRIAQLKESWIRNVVRIMNITEEEAKKIYDRIQPHKGLNS